MLKLIAIALTLCLPIRTSQVRKNGRRPQVARPSAPNPNQPQAACDLGMFK